MHCWWYIGVGTMGAPGGRCPSMFSNNYIARLNFIHTDHTALAYRSIEPPFTKPSSYASVVKVLLVIQNEDSYVKTTPPPVDALLLAKVLLIILNEDSCVFTTPPTVDQ